jgi:hypothetical protein
MTGSSSRTALVLLLSLTAAHAQAPKLGLFFAASFPAARRSGSCPAVSTKSGIREPLELWVET